MKKAEKNWVKPDAIMVPEQYLNAVSRNPVVADALYRRGYTTIEDALAFLDPDQYKPTSGEVFPDMDKVVSRIQKAIRDHEWICIWGDFDVDGQTSTTLLHSGLQALGANAIFHIPNREKESHGVHLQKLRQLLSDGVELVITCDTGISDMDPLAFAKQSGVDVIVTDHHEIPDKMPETYAIINPKSFSTDHPLRELPGVGVAYKVIESLYEAAGRPTQHFLDLVALGIVADLAVQTKDTRFLLQRGLPVLRETPRLGLQKIMENAEISPRSLNEEHISFFLAPRLNSLGRMGDASDAIELLTTTDPRRAGMLATQLEGLNAKRRFEVNQLVQSVLLHWEKNPESLEQSILIVEGQEWPAGILGVVASRLVDQFHKPIIVLSTGVDEITRGSARSIPGVHITNVIAEQQAYLIRFGGHPMAAGLALKKELLPEFRQKATQTVDRIFAGKIPKPQLEIDALINLSGITTELILELEKMAPFGKGNPGLVFVTENLSLVERRPLGRQGEHTKLTFFDDNGTHQDVIWWRGGEQDLPSQNVDLAYSLRFNEYGGKQYLQAEYIDSHARLDLLAREVTEKKPVALVDLRDCRDPKRELETILQEDETALIWAEGNIDLDYPTLSRDELNPSRKLIIWSIPPSPLALTDAIHLVKPEIVILFAVDPGISRPKVLLHLLIRLLKFVMKNHDGHVGIHTLAAKTSQTDLCIKKALAWCQARGIIDVHWENPEWIRVIEGKGKMDDGVSMLEAELQGLLEESQAYRNYFKKAPARFIIREEES